ncbi:transcription factor [Kwoniella heveanensis BCC8398]|uniref:Transcription factor n=1 Tax=Kwoniella heveanensis BCC8398 TaxID=1296120 RepID=A0A1B9H176_9TREE|nr:transcription factor [Kwoniella heveanensis BCC8398]
MDAFGLPMSFGKKSKAPTVNLKAKLDTTKRDVAAPPPTTTKTDSGFALQDDQAPASGPSRPSSSTDKNRLSPSGKQDQNGNGVNDDDDDVGPKPPSPSTGDKRKLSTDENGAAAADENVDDDDDEEEYDDEEEVDRTPISHEIVLKDHTKVVSALAVDPSGARLATGSHDYDTKIWDFGGMDRRLKPFKSFEANGNYYVHDLSYSANGQSLLVISGTVQPKVFNKEGDEGVEYNKGDVYLRDMKNTNGHTAEITGGSFHPTDNSQFLTCSNDSTLRLWDVENKRKQKQVIVVKSKERGARTKVTACAWSPDGKMIAGACLDGALHIWNTSSNFARPNYSNETAHAKNTETTGVVFARDGRRVATRGGDDTVKLWDIRSIRKPIAVASGLDNLYPETNIIFSSDEKSILTGIAAPKGQKGGLVFLNGEDLKEERRVAIGEGSVVRVVWHSRINQIFASLSTGAVHVLYSPHSSIHGALLPLSKMPKTAPRDPSFSTSDLNPVIYTPDALPMFRDQGHRESLHQKEKKAKKFKPMEPMRGAGRGGRLGASETQGFVQTLFPETLKFEDPREALLKYAEKKDEEE